MIISPIFHAKHKHLQKGIALPYTPYIENAVFHGKETMTSFQKPCAETARPLS